MLLKIGPKANRIQRIVLSQGSIKRGCSAQPGWLPIEGQHCHITPSALFLDPKSDRVGRSKANERRSRASAVLCIIASFRDVDDGPLQSGQLRLEAPCDCLQDNRFVNFD